VGKRVIFSDLEKFLTGHIRTELAMLPGQPYQGGWVSNQFYSPDPDIPRSPPPYQIVVRDDSGPDTSIITQEPTVGVTVLMGEDPTEGQAATDLALVVKMIVKDCAGIGADNPVAAVLGCTGPYKVPDPTGVPSRYMTFELAVTGKSYP
jgi:hypothetical protein